MIEYQSHQSETVSTTINVANQVFAYTTSFQLVFAPVDIQKTVEISRAVGRKAILSEQDISTTINATDQVLDSTTSFRLAICAS